MQNYLRPMLVLGASALCWALPLLASAQTPFPRLKPENASLTSYARTTTLSSTPAPRLRKSSQYLNESDFKVLKKGLRSAHAGNWASAERYRQQLQDPVAKDLLLWARASRDRNIPFAQLTDAAQQLSDWPRRTQIMAKAEKELFDNPLSASETLSWFWGKEPVSGEGRAALARAHYGLGDTTSGDMWLKSAWRESKLTRSRQQKVFTEYKTKLSPDDHYARADHLMWQGRSYYSSAQALLPHMHKDKRALMQARLKIAMNGSGMNTAVKAVPANLKNDPGLIYERAKWRKKHQSKDSGMSMLNTMRSSTESEHGKKVIWKMKKNLIYWAIKEKRYHEAYQLTQHHGMTAGGSFAEAEFLAGWIALTKLGGADVAAKHFETLASGVTYPVSLSRAHYWQGRAAERTGDPNAQAYYSAASRFPNTFYGQLANESLSSKLTMVSLPPQVDSKPLRQSFEAASVVRAMNLLGETDDEAWFNQFVYHLDDKVEDIKELALLSEISREYGYMKPSLRAAKQASRFQSMLTESGYPVIPAIYGLPDKFDKPFVFAIARQESEFDYKAVSSAKAYGLMQMIDGTAKATARKHRIPYNKAKMTKDINYSANLGAHHLNDLLKQFDGSYIMAAAAYNAGAGRVRQWNTQFGDPRRGEIDPIDWVESIPFSETRNYVQRVMENVQVYRARLNNNQTESRINQDLHHGAAIR